MEKKIMDFVAELEEKRDAACCEAEHNAFSYAVDTLYAILAENAVTCKDCGATFVMTEKEVAFYKKNNLYLPKRCPDCRAERKTKKLAAASVK